MELSGNTCSETSYGGWNSEIVMDFYIDFQQNFIRITNTESFDNHKECFITKAYLFFVECHFKLIDIQMISRLLNVKSYQDSNTNLPAWVSQSVVHKVVSNPVVNR